MEHCILKIALDTPLDFCFDYLWTETAANCARPQPGQLALVPFGRRQVIGLIVAVVDRTEVPPDKLKQISAVRAQLAPLSETWLELCRFAAEYYQRYSVAHAELRDKFSQPHKKYATSDDN